MKRKTKIVCTLGPSTDSEQAIEALARAGMDVARINFSHSEPARVKHTLKAIRRVSKRLGTPLAVIADLPGPKIRIGEVAPDTQLERGARVVLTAEDRPGGAELLSIPFPGVVSALKPGHRVFLDDGNIELEVVGKRGRTALCRVVVGGPISSHKGVALPKTKLAVRTPTEHDLAWLKFAVENRFDWVAASFVGAAGDVTRLRAAQRPRGALPVIAKIEKRSALECIDEVTEVSDAVMVARGDLGVEIPIERVPLAQKEIITRCRGLGKPVITATQMLDSMTHNRRPTRAEATDVANAVLDGTDAVMLSAETAVGQYPEEAVSTMAAIARAAEASPAFEAVRGTGHLESKETPVTAAIAAATVEIAIRVKAKAIVSFTASGRTARAVSRLRPKARIIAATMTEQVQRVLALSWGVSPVLVPRARNTDEVLAHASGAALESGFVKCGETIVVTAGIPTGVAGSTNLVKVAIV
jgi:pyruvate kinase